MKKFLIMIAINVFALLMISKIVIGISITEDGKFETLIVSAIILAFVNIFLKPIIKLITFPLNILSFGLFTLFINAFLLSLVSKLVKGFYVSDFGAAFIGALLLSITYLIIDATILKKNIKILKDYNPDKYQNSEYTDTIPKDKVIDIEATDENDKKERKGIEGELK